MSVTFFTSFSCATVFLLFVFLFAFFRLRVPACRVKSAGTSTFYDNIQQTICTDWWNGSHRKTCAARHATRIRNPNLKFIASPRRYYSMVREESIYIWFLNTHLIMMELRELSSCMPSSTAWHASNFRWYTHKLSLAYMLDNFIEPVVVARSALLFYYVPNTFTYRALNKTIKLWQKVNSLCFTCTSYTNNVYCICTENNVSILLEKKLFLDYLHSC